MNITNKESIILSLLSDHDKMYGLEMVKADPQNLKRGTIYVTLDRLEDKGLIESTTQPTRKGQRGPGRRIYQLTGLGVRVLEAHEMMQQIRTQPGLGMA